MTAQPSPAVGLVELDELHKSYGVTSALQGLSRWATPGEILGVAGPNGAGKSTTMRILAGEEEPDFGKIRLDGRPWPIAERRHQVAVVHQEPQLYPTLTVTENLLVGREMGGPRRPRAGERERRLLATLGIERFSDRPLDRCSLVVWQLTEIARALLRDARLFLFDEPNSALNEPESQQLFELLLRMRAEGTASIMLVSHRLSELAMYADRVAIISEGRCSAVLEGASLTAERIATELVAGTAAGGLTLSPQVEARERTPAPAVVVSDRTAVTSAPAAPSGEPVLRLRDWSHPYGMFHVEELDLPTSCVIAFTGVEGSGARELLRSIAGVGAGRGQREIVNSTDAGAQSARSSVQYVAADRAVSLFPNFSVGANLISRQPTRAIASRVGRLQRRKVRSLSEELVQQFQIKAASPRVPIGTLSGGNQQKVAVAAAISRQPRLLVVEEPTRGVDVRTKAEVYQLLRSWAREGNAVLVYCTEVPEAFELADIAYVVSGGRLSRPVHVSAHDDVSSLAAFLATLESQSTA
jgi:ABC-type sugar transport system ATPase subunit